MTSNVLYENYAPNDVKALYFNAFAKFKLKNYEDASKVGEKLMTVDPDHSEGKKLLAQIKKTIQTNRIQNDRPRNLRSKGTVNVIG